MCEVQPEKGADKCRKALADANITRESFDAHFARIKEERVSAAAKLDTSTQELTCFDEKNSRINVALGKNDKGGEGGVDGNRDSDGGSELEQTANATVPTR
jgi:hypothetical protein